MFFLCEATVLAKRGISAIFTTYLPGEIMRGKLLLLWVDLGDPSLVISSCVGGNLAIINLSALSLHHFHWLKL